MAEGITSSWTSAHANTDLQQDNWNSKKINPHKNPTKTHQSDQTSQTKLKPGAEKSAYPRAARTPAATQPGVQEQMGFDFGQEERVKLRGERGRNPNFSANPPTRISTAMRGAVAICESHASLPVPIQSGQTSIIPNLEKITPLDFKLTPPTLPRLN